MNRTCCDTFTPEIFNSGVTQRFNVAKDKKLDHAKRNGIYYVNTYISHQCRNLIWQTTSNAAGTYNPLNWCELICMGKLNPSEVKEHSTEAVMQKGQNVPTYEKVPKHALGHFPKCRGKMSRKKAAKHNQVLSSLLRMVQINYFQWLVLPLGWWDSGCLRLNKWPPFREEWNSEEKEVLMKAYSLMGFTTGNSWDAIGHYNSNSLTCWAILAQE